jgi:hypothetical protein
LHFGLEFALLDLGKTSLLLLNRFDLSLTLLLRLTPLAF